MTLWLTLIFLTAAIFLFIGLFFGRTFQRGEQDDAWMDYAYENSCLLHQRDELEAELNAMKHNGK